MLLSTKFEEFFMMNSNYGKTYNTFAEHPLAPIYFKYIDLLISRDLNQDVQHLLDIAHAPMTEENIEIVTNIVAALVEIANEDNVNEFEELRQQLENPN